MLPLALANPAAEESSEMGGSKRGDGFGLGRGGVGPAASEAGASSLLSQLGGRGEMMGGREEVWGGEGGGNPMRHREARQREGNAS